MRAFDRTHCTLGEGPLWHPQRNSLIWFDILGKKMFERSADHVRDWLFDEHVSAAGWIDAESILLASETALWRFDLTSGERESLCPLEADTPATRSNDGRADPWGGFWIGTMGKSAEPNAGAIYRYYKGTLRKLVPGVTISNAICFAPDRTCAYYTDTVTGQIMRVALDRKDGWPTAKATVHIDLRADKLNPDGAVTDAQGNLWLALWGASRVACFDPDGTHLRDIALPAKQPTCPAFGGPDLRDLIVTSAAQGQPAGDASKDGMTFILPDTAQGQPEPQVIL